MSDQLSLLQQHFDTALESPNGIKKLRELILTLAMQGKLVKQEPKDQPANELLKEIQAEKERLIKEGKIKKQKELSPIKPGEVPYEVPEGWEWVKLAEIVDVGTGSTPTTTNHEYYNGTIPWYTSSATNNPMAAEPDKFITEKAIKETNCKVFPTGSLIIALYGQGKTRGQISEIVIPGATNQAIAAMVFYESSQPIKVYLKYFFIKIYSEIRLLAAGAAQPNLNVGKIKETLIPLPPIAEQKRIVAKIDELMALCDKLEFQRKDRNDKRLTVHTAAINRLLTAADTNDFDSAWQFITRHFDPLYSVKENVAELKKAILTLAMQGKLVKQNPKDQPARELLEEIQADKERLIKEGKIKKQKELPPIKPEEVPYQVPSGWEWVRLGEISSVQTGKKDVNEGHENGRYPFFSCAQIPLKSNEYSYDTEALLLPGNGANVGQVTYYNGKFEAYQRTYILSDFFPDTIVFVQKTLEARFLQSLEGKQYGSAINYIKLGSLTDFLVPLPPLAEQKRIVAKIDELMALCEKLETQIDQATTKQTALFDAVLAKV